MKLTFADLRAANVARLPDFKSARGKLAHTKADGSDWSILEWMGAACGEAGEAANIAKKLRRGDVDLDSPYEGPQERGWLVERTHLDGRQIQSPDWWVGDGWSTDSVKALRFCRRADAEVMSLWITRDSASKCQATEHVWMSKSVTTREALGKELADIVCYVDHVANQAGLNLDECVIQKFNEISERVGSSVRLEPGCVIASPCDHGVSFDSGAYDQACADLEKRVLIIRPSERELLTARFTSAVRRRWPRLDGECPKGCGYVGIFYASAEHMLAGDW